MNPVELLIALLLSASSVRSASFTMPSLYCFRLPDQRGNAFSSGRNMPMYTWFRKVPSVLTLTGKLTEANTLLTAWISEKMTPMALRISLPVAPEPPSKYLPPLVSAMLLSSAVQPGVWPVTFGLTSIVYVVIRRGLFFMKRAHSSATLVVQSRSARSGSVSVAPATPTAAAAVVSQVVAVLCVRAVLRRTGRC